MTDRYQFELWGWKKYNQGGRSQVTRSSKHQPQNNPDDSSDDAAMSHTCEGSRRDIAFLRKAALDLFTLQGVDEKALETLKDHKPGDLGPYLWLCFNWCKLEIRKHDAQLPPPFHKGKETETDVSDSVYVYDVHIFIFLLHRFFESPESFPDQDQWAKRASRATQICPIMVLCMMAALIVTAAINKERSCCGASPSTPLPSTSGMFKFVMRGMDLIDDESKSSCWSTEKMVEEFMLEFQDKVQNCTEFGKATNSAVKRYMHHNWPKSTDNMEPNISTGEGEGYSDWWNCMHSMVDGEFMFE
jgi:hypothetical protein